ncbi:MAG: CdaR family protein [Eubacteriales bacterium]
MEKIKLFLNRLKNNWKMKVVALVLALFLWNSVIQGTDPLISRTTDPIPITLIGAEQLSSKGLAIYNESEEYLQSVKVTVWMKRSEAKLFDQSKIQVTLDLSRINTVGEQIVKVNAYYSEGTVEKVTPESFTLQVDQKKSKIVSIEYNVTGELPDGYYQGEISVDPKSVQITGPSSIVDLVEKAIFTVDLTDKVASMSLPKEIFLVDADGNIINSDTLVTSVDSAMFEMKISPRKEIKIIGESLVKGTDKLPAGYEIESIEVYPSKVEVTGTTEALEGLTSLPSEIKDVAGESEDVHTTIKLLAPKGVEFLTSDTVSVIIRIREIMEKATYENKTVELRNIPSGMTVQDFEEIRTVEMTVPYNTISTLTSSHVKLYIDLAGLSEGEHELKIQCEVPEEFRAENIVIENDTAIVNLVSNN